MKKQMVRERLQTLVGFVENIEGLISNPYTAEIKTGELLKDIKSYVNETIQLVDEIEEMNSDNSATEEAEVEELK